MVHGYHVIFGAYGFWLPNDPRGSRRWACDHGGGRRDQWLQRNPPSTRSPPETAGILHSQWQSPSQQSPLGRG